MPTSRATLTPQQVSGIRTELERMLRRLERSIGANGDGPASREIDQSSVGRLSRIEALQNQGLTDSLRERERSQLEEVLQALSRLDTGTYGLCAGCQEPIAHERLEIFPETRMCGECPEAR